MTTNFRGKSGQIVQPTFICRAVVQKRIRISMAHEYSYNLVRFGAVSPKFTLLLLICVQQASISLLLV